MKMKWMFHFNLCAFRQMKNELFRFLFFQLRPLLYTPHLIHINLDRIVCGVSTLYMFRIELVSGKTSPPTIIYSEKELSLRR